MAHLCTIATRAPPPAPAYLTLTELDSSFSFFSLEFSPPPPRALPTATPTDSPTRSSYLCLSDAPADRCALLWLATQRAYVCAEQIYDDGIGGAVLELNGGGACNLFPQVRGAYITQLVVNFQRCHSAPHR